MELYPVQKFTNKCGIIYDPAGFTEEATAGMMGNLMAESGMDPTVIQNGGAGPAGPRDHAMGKL